MRFHFHGGAQEVGRSCIEIEGSSRFILDAGIELSSEGPLLPSKIEKLHDLDAVLISHAHLDHIGALPLFHHYGLSCPIYATAGTKSFSRILLNDSLKIARLEHQHIEYEKRDVPAIISLFRDVQYRQSFAINSAEITFFDAGHIPASASILVQMDGKRILYSGDIQVCDTQLLRGIDMHHYGDVDILIVESTYGNREHKERIAEEKRFVENVAMTIKRGGRAVISSFAMGRAQEIALLLGKHSWNVPIYMDGMARTMSELCTQYSDLIRDPEALSRAMEQVHFITTDEQRKEIIKNPCIIITTSGMVSGGPVIGYLEKIAHDERSAIFLTGYQAEGTGGRMIQEQASMMFEGHHSKLRCQIYDHDFSGHAGRSDLHTYISTVKPTALIINHGDPDAIMQLATWAKEQGITTYTPSYDEQLEL